MCFREVNYSVFARHLEACMGLGRRSLRSRVTIYNKENLAALYEDEAEEKINKRKENKKKKKNLSNK